MSYALKGSPIGVHGMMKKEKRRAYADKKPFPLKADGHITMSAPSLMWFVGRVYVGMCVG
jgi:hypothetical protein